MVKVEKYYRPQHAAIINNDLCNLAMLNQII